MKTMKKILPLILSASAVMASSVTAMAAVPGVVTVPNDASKTGYTSSFTYIDPAATNVQLMGGFQFYFQNDLNVYANGFILPAYDTQANHLFGPEEWENNGFMHHINDAGYKMDMSKIR